MKQTTWVFALGLSLALLAGILLPSCDKWTEPQAEDYYIAPSEAYKNNLKSYFDSPHKVMFGWFGNWAGKGGSSKQFELCGLPDSVDFVSLWLCWGNINDAQLDDLRDFQARGSKAILCWRAGNIGANLTPAGKDPFEFWGYTKGDEESSIRAAQKYAKAIVDTCDKYGVDGFDYDIEDWGTLMNSGMKSVANAFMKTLREEFDKTGKMLVADIPGGSGWLSFYDVLTDETVKSLDYIVWQTYDLGQSGLDSFFYGGGDWGGSVRSHKPEIFEEVMRKSIVTATFEEAAKKYHFAQQQVYRPSFGIEHAGMGAYHIEYDYPGNPDYATVRAAISAQNPPVNE